MAASARSILHVDMDAFYASVEQRDNPELRGKPLAVGGTGSRGVVAAASYEAREFGVRSAMPMREALRRCPDLLRVRPRMSHYKAVSEQVFEIFRRFTPLVEGLSLDEAFLDVTASENLFGDPVDIALSIKQQILDTTRVTASVGVAHNKLVAKIASDLDKPDGLTVLYPENYEARLDPLPVSVIPGIGSKTLGRLTGTGIATVRDLRLAPDRVLEPVFGRFTAKTRTRASGLDDRPVVPSRAEKSISAEETFDTDLAKREDMERELLRLSDRTATRLRKAELAAGIVQVKIRQADFTTFTRQRRLNPPANGTDQVYAVARDLLGAWLAENPGTRIRLLGVGGSELGPAGQADLFGEHGVESPVDNTVDEIRDRFGSKALGRARTMDRDKP
ncbi:MAG: DNA polymerase IV [Gammaproteobacteria bacterium]|nr:DNA polymerase IV [Gammaproteobacteria bacterium]NNF48757.1 DNA polymerase IV [Woeseiaceae bacterium]MBT8094602.1 DNA polymerase IV [Gammaproteobacteria bacterium]MBT8106367.1 DNA polymerase IV [Gammaproteobacteria bacterium]NNK26382.1 DNA polymerase IV [Woeseiaceae bacterium]